MRVLSFAMAISLIGGVMLSGCAKKAVTSKTLEEELKVPPKEQVVPEAKPVEERVARPEEVGPPIKPAEIPPVEVTPKVVKPLEEVAVPEAPMVMLPKEVAPQVEAKKEVAPVPAVKRIGDIFFDYDRFYIRDDARPTLEDNAEYLKGNKDASILIEGHCDERGTSEYNIALGERRAQATKRYLVDLGIDPSRISTISYGKERPFCTAHNEGCWQENRRSHFVGK